MRVRGGGEPPKPASSRDNDSLQHSQVYTLSMPNARSGSPLYIKMDVGD